MGLTTNSESSVCALQGFTHQLCAIYYLLFWHWKLRSRPPFRVKVCACKVTLLECGFLWVEYTHTHTQEHRNTCTQPAGCKFGKWITGEKLSMDSFSPHFLHQLQFIYLRQLTPILFIRHWRRYYEPFITYFTPDTHTRTFKKHLLLIKDV